MAAIAQADPAAPEVPDGTGWRVEVTHSGRRYIHRRGWGKNRESGRGGAFAELSNERRLEYGANSTKRRQAKTRAAKG